MQSTPLTRRLQRLFRATHADSGARFAAALAAGDREGAQRIGHNLRSGAAMLGAGQLAELAQAAERALRSPQPEAESLAAAAALIPALEEELRRLIERLPAAEEEGPVAAAPLPEPAEAPARLAELLTTLRGHRGRAVHLFESLLADSAGSPLAAALAQAREPIDRFDFDQAAEVVELLLRALGGEG